MQRRLRKIALEIIVNALDVAEQISKDGRHKQVQEFQKRVYCKENLVEIIVRDCLENEQNGKVKIESDHSIYAKAFAYMPLHIMNILNPPILNKPLKKQGEENILSIENYLKTLLTIFGNAKHDSFT